jgi:hypothetical protein
MTGKKFIAIYIDLLPGNYIAQIFTSFLHRISFTASLWSENLLAVGD